ncbi:MAG: hypothetical protein IKP40_09405, partial [Clostridia bacterium]|nr:hypothetical protein [Clostridia bacterium]
RFHELSHDWLWKTAEITTTSRGSKVESALLSPLPELQGQWGYPSLEQSASCLALMMRVS